MKKKIFFMIALSLLLVALFAVSVSATVNDYDNVPNYTKTYTMDEANHLNLSHIMTLFDVSGFVDFNASSNIAGVIVFNNIFGNDCEGSCGDEYCMGIDFYCGLLKHFMPTLEINTSYSFRAANGRFMIETASGKAELAGTVFVTEELLNGHFYWEHIKPSVGNSSEFWFYQPLVKKGEITENDLHPYTWPPFYDVVTIVNETVWDKYPTLNMLPYEYDWGNSDRLGVNFRVNPDGTLTLNGTVNSNTGYVSFSFLNDAMLALPTTVTLSGFPDGVVGSKETFYMQMIIDGGWTAGCYDTLTVTSRLGAKLNNVIFYAKNGVTFTEFTIKPMLNAGYVAYPYQPYLEYHWNEHYSSAFTDGKNEGINEGYSNGFQKGQTAGWSMGYNAGETFGYENGYADAKVEHYNLGYAAGKTFGYENGYAEAKVEHYNLGYAAGEQSTVTRDFKNIVSEIAFAPYKAISAMFDFEVFGINIAGAIFTIFTLLVFAIVLGFVIKLIF